MKKENCLKALRDITRKDIVISIRVNEAESKFISEQKLSPQLIFHEALKDLGFK